jgi:hypothetical protein
VVHLVDHRVIEGTAFKSLEDFGAREFLDGSQHKVRVEVVVRAHAPCGGSGAELCGEQTVESPFGLGKKVRPMRNNQDAWAASEGGVRGCADRMLRATFCPCRWRP